MTMFNQLDIQGFKSFEYASLSLHPLTILRLSLKTWGN